MHRSPVAVVLDELCLSTQDCSLAAGCAPAAISAAKSGQPIPLALRVFLDQAGVDVCRLEVEQTAWREAKGSAIRSRVLSGRGGSIPGTRAMAGSAVTK